jgi:Glyoxalase-like domain
MTVRVQCICIDAQDPAVLGRWWSDVLGWRCHVHEDGTAVLEPPDADPHFPSGQPDLLFVPVRETKAVKNRLHIDLRPDDQSTELARLEAMGARRVDIGQRDAASWIVLADPEANEFCLLRALRPDELVPG